MRMSASASARESMNDDNISKDATTKVYLPPGILGDGFDVSEPSEAMIASWLKKMLKNDVEAVDTPRLASLLRARLIAGHAAIEHVWASSSFSSLIQQTQQNVRSEQDAIKDAAHAAERRSWQVTLDRLEMEWRSRLSGALEGRLSLSRELESTRDQMTALTAQMRDGVERARQEAEKEAESRWKERMEVAIADAEGRATTARRQAEIVMGNLSELSDVKVAMQALGSQVGTLSSATTNAEIRKLDSQLADAKKEIERLRGTNHIKGMLGEQAVMNVMKTSAAFDEWAFTDTSGRGAQSDFHMTSPCGNMVIAFEVKNKASITHGDVDKSMRDIGELAERMGSKFAGYVFVSLCTRNIPRKGGGLRMERVAGVPALWFGTEAFLTPDAAGPCEDALRELVRATRLVLDVKNTLATTTSAAIPNAAYVAGSIPTISNASGAEEEQHQKHPQEAAMDALQNALMQEKQRADVSDAQSAKFLSAINAQLTRISNLRKTILTIQDIAGNLRKHAALLASDIDASYRHLEGEMRSSNCMITKDSFQQQHDDDDVVVEVDMNAFEAAAASTPKPRTKKRKPITSNPSSSNPSSIASLDLGDASAASSEATMKRATCGKMFKNQQAVNGHTASCAMCKSKTTN